MVKIKTKVGDIGLVCVPNDVNWVEISKNNLGGFINTSLDLKENNYFLQYGKEKCGFPPSKSVYYNPKTFYCLVGIKNPIYIGKLSQLDKELEEFVDRWGDDISRDIVNFIALGYSDIVKIDGNGNLYYKDYLDNMNNNYTLTPKQSFISLIKSQHPEFDESKEYLLIKLL